jgi:uncharacterized protein YcfL
MKKINLMLFAGIMLGLTASCTTPVSSVERETPVGTPDIIPDKRVITDPRMDVQVVQVNESVVSGDLTKVQVILRSTSNRAKSINYRFDWYDLDGIVVTTNNPWKSLTLQGQQQVAVTATAPNPRAKDFRLNLQRSQN